MDILQFIKGKTFDAEELLNDLREKEVSTYWHPGSFRDMRGIQWYRNREVEKEPAPDESIPLFVATNPEFVTGMTRHGAQVEAYLSLNEDNQLGVVKVHPLEFDPSVSFRFYDGRVREDVWLHNNLYTDIGHGQASAYLVEFHLNET